MDAIQPTAWKKFDTPAVATLFYSPSFIFSSTLKPAFLKSGREQEDTEEEATVEGGGMYMHTKMKTGAPGQFAALGVLVTKPDPPWGQPGPQCLAVVFGCQEGWQNMETGGPDLWS